MNITPTTVEDIFAASLPLGEFEQLVLLALVRLSPDAYGATVRREIEQRAGREVSISAVYTTLERLEQKGAYPVTHPASRPRSAAEAAAAVQGGRVTCRRGRTRDRERAL
jgi:PadR family transcriptional regulator PadR